MADGRVYHDLETRDPAEIDEIKVVAIMPNLRAKIFFSHNLSKSQKLN
jgi:hypothetical protein